MVELEPPLSVESAPPVLVTAPVVEAPPVVVEFVESAHVVEYVTRAPAVTYAVPAHVDEFAVQGLELHAAVSGQARRCEPRFRGQASVRIQ